MALAHESNIAGFELGNPVTGEPAWTSLDEERWEVLESIVESMGMPYPNADRAAACSYLVQHLTRSSVSS